MFAKIIKKFIGSKNQREIKKLLPIAQKINAIEETFQKESEEFLRDKTRAWQKELSAIEKQYHDKIEAEEKEKQEKSPQKIEEELSQLAPNEHKKREALTQEKEQIENEIAEQIRNRKQDSEDKVLQKQQEILDRILPEAFAVVKNMARRLCGQSWTVSDQTQTWNMVHFDVQLLGGIGLHRGMIAEMATGEGKTLVATLPVYLNALSGRGVHLITVNDYLAKRDAEWMGELYKKLGLTVGCIQSQQAPDVRRAQYECDITYGTNAEFGFDYLRDNGMATNTEEQVQRGHFYALIDEVDSILIDEARTPLIISGPVTVDTHQFDKWKPYVQRLANKQNELCARFISEAKEYAEQEDYAAAAHTLLKVKFGQPRSRRLMRFMEDPKIRREIEKAELSLYQNNRKKALFELKEELYFSLDDKARDADLTEKGRHFLDSKDTEAFVLPDLATEFAEIDGNSTASAEEKEKQKQALQTKLDSQGQRLHNISQLLRAYTTYERDREYVVKENKVIIVDQNTGREMPGRRWSDGLHQAVEAKEGVKIDKETQTFATITIQNYFRLYYKLGGMTGTAETEAAEFNDIYKLDVLQVPTNRPIGRVDQNDRIYKTKREKINALLELIKERHAKKQPILVGTTSVESSETVSRMLKRIKIPHAVLNAKYHRQEAEIVSNAGQKGAVTVSTNMAGRGTDIKLGEGVIEAGGLLVIGTERHESRRIDRQLRGRCARQGDPGESLFFISFEDDLMRNFGATDKMTGFMEKFGLKDGEELSHPWLNKSVETAQKRVESRNYEWRKRVLEFDDVMNQQREILYGYRNETIESANPRILIEEAISEVLTDKVHSYLVSEKPDASEYEALLGWTNSSFPLGLTQESAGFESRSKEENITFLIEKILTAYQLRTRGKNPQALQHLERYIILNAIDRLWQEHLYNMDALREGVYLRAQGQKDPLVEYKNEAYNIFSHLMVHIKQEILNNLFRSTSSLEQFEQMLQQGAQRKARRGRAKSKNAQKPLTQDNMASSMSYEALLQNLAAQKTQAKKKQQGK